MKAGQCSSFAVPDSCQAWSSHVSVRLKRMTRCAGSKETLAARQASICPQAGDTDTVTNATIPTLHESFIPRLQVLNRRIPTFPERRACVRPRENQARTSVRVSCRRLSVRPEEAEMAGRVERRDTFGPRSARRERPLGARLSRPIWKQSRTRSS